MAVFSYTAADNSGNEQTGTLLADTPFDGRQRLRDRGLQVLAFGQARVPKSGPVPTMGLRRREEQVAEIARQLSMLLRSSVPLAESIDVLTRGRRNGLGTVLTSVRDRVTGGASLGDAMAEHPQWFDTLFVSAVRVGELTGNLDESLSHLAEHLRGQQTLRNRLTNALTYPLILLVVGIGVVLFLMSFVVPQLLEVLTASGRPLPASTVLLKGASDLLVHHWLVLGFSGIALGITTWLVGRSESGQRLWHRAQLRTPLLGSLVQKHIVAQFAQRMAVMLQTGIPFVEALRATRALTRNRVLADELEGMTGTIESGGDIAPTMEGSRVFPPVVAHLIGVGQESGELTTMLEELRSRYETEVDLAIGRFTAALEPLLIVLLAGGVGFVVFASLMPILEATRAIQ